MIRQKNIFGNTRQNGL